MPARAIAWMFAALNTIEPSIFERAISLVVEADDPWHARRLAMLDDRIHARLSELARHLGDAEWLDGDFSAGDLLMLTVLLRLERSGLLDEYSNLAAYLARGRARPAFQRAFDAQLEVFQSSVIP